MHPVVHIETTKRLKLKPQPNCTQRRGNMTSKPLTSAAGIPIANNQHALTAGPRGPLLVQDWQLFEKHAHFNRERIPERVVHAKGSGAYGHFMATKDLSAYTRASLFAKPGKQTEVFLRFSTVAGERGAADAERDVRGFAVKFYTDQGNWDLVGNNTPVFFIRDPYKFPDFVHTQKRDPRTNLRNPVSMWDFWSRSPESMHQITILFSDRGLPRDYRHINGYGSHTYSFTNEEGARFWVKFHFKSMQGITYFTDEEAEKVVGQDRESAQRDLVEAIDRGDFPQWRVMVQIMPEAEADSRSYNPFDLTKVWPNSEYPLIEAGILELNRNPDDFFAEVEQSGFSPGNVVPGIGHSPDKMLQFRVFSYADAQRNRLGVNYQNLPVNKPKCPYHHYLRDGAMRADDNGGGGPNYEPNSFNGPVERPEFAEPPLQLDGAADRYDHNLNNDDFSQAGDLYRLMDEDQKQRLVANIARTMDGVPEQILRRQLPYFFKADQDYGKRLAKLVGLAGIDFTGGDS